MRYVLEGCFVLRLVVVRLGCGWRVGYDVGRGGGVGGFDL